MQNLTTPLIAPHRSNSGLLQKLRRRCQRADLKYHLKCWVKGVTVLLVLFYILGFLSWNYWMECNMKTILLWNDKIPKRSSLLGNFLSCNCVITTDRRYTRHTIDAILFNGDEPFTLNGFDEVKTSPDFLGIYKATKPFNELLPPPTFSNLTPYNLTMTYRTDSDAILGQYFMEINDTYMPCVKFKQPNYSFMQDLALTERVKLTQMLAFKNRIAVYKIFPVEADTKARSLLLMMLRLRFNLDATDNCDGPLNCLPYKFMLIFDTSQCPDYINPEFFMALKKYIVPVVFNGHDYSRFAPPGSYIRAEDYKNAEELGHYLRRLDTDLEAYKRFFWWRAYYKISNSPETYCTICNVINNLSLMPRKPATEATFMKWWFNSNCTKK